LLMNPRNARMVCQLVAQARCAVGGAVVHKEDSQIRKRFRVL